MKKELSPREKEVLATLYDLPVYRVLKKHLENERLNIATKCVTLDPREVTEMARLQGQAQALKLLHLDLREMARKQADKVEN